MKCRNAICGLSIAVVLLLGVLASSAQTVRFLYTGSETNITLNPGTYNITAYGAQGGSNWVFASSLGAEMEGQFNFAGVTTLTLLVGGSGGFIITGDGGGGGGGSFVVNGSTPLVIAGGGGGSGGLNGGYGGGGDGTVGEGNGSGGGGGGYSGGGGGGSSGGIGGGGGGGSIIDSSAITNLAEVSGVASPDDPPNGEIIITAVSAPAPTTLGITMVSNQPVVFWPASATNVVLHMTTNLTSGNWVTFTNGIPVTFTNGMLFSGLQITNAHGTAFFRLQ